MSGRRKRGFREDDVGPGSENLEGVDGTLPGPSLWGVDALAERQSDDAPCVHEDTP